MAANIQSYVVVATKTAAATGDVRFDVYASTDGVNANGDLRFSFMLSNANCTSMNTTVNGGSAGTSLSFNYAQNYNNQLYQQGQVWIT